MRPVSGFVLAGGQGSRMQAAGQGTVDKSLLEVGGRRLVERAAEKLAQVCASVGILCGPSEREERFAAFGHTVPDAIAGCGPIGGLHAALLRARLQGGGWSTEPWVLLLQVDVPFLPAEALARLCDAAIAHGPGVACMDAQGMVQPLPVCLHRDVLPTVERAIAAGEHRLRPVLQQCARDLGKAITTVQIPGEAEERWFHNVNTPEDLARARRLAAEEVF